MALVYLIKSLTSKNPWVYVGSTEDFKIRLSQHNSGQVISTKSRRPFELVYSEEYSSIKEARLREREIKRSRILKESILKKIN